MNSSFLFKCVLFDLDGTLLDTHKDLGNALNHVRAHEGLAPLPLEQLRDHVSNGANALIRHSFGDDISDEILQKYRGLLLAFYLDNIAKHTIPFDGILQLLQKLHAHKILWGVVTNKPRAYTDALLPHIDFPASPNVVVCPDDIGIAKPDPTPLTHACKLVNVSTSQTIYIGDHKRDIECADRAGMPSIAVGYGYTEHPEAHLTWQATHTVEHASEIWPIIRTH